MFVYSDSLSNNAQLKLQIEELENKVTKVSVEIALEKDKQLKEASIKHATELHNLKNRNEELMKKLGCQILTRQGDVFEMKKNLDGAKLVFEQGMFQNPDDPILNKRLDLLELRIAKINENEKEQTEQRDDDEETLSEVSKETGQKEIGETERIEYGETNRIEYRETSAKEIERIGLEEVGETLRIEYEEATLLEEIRETGLEEKGETMGTEQHNELKDNEEPILHDSGSKDEILEESGSSGTEDSCGEEDGRYKSLGSQDMTDEEEDDDW
ncbi:repetitive organellar protein-like [Clytia hemisphaerica]|uniref:repetitive organellar protein-like n=1 Tax=Clytia hemisphaerica TaxID=252671 RepID=UPI0034D7B079